MICSDVVIYSPCLQRMLFLGSNLSTKEGILVHACACNNQLVPNMSNNFFKKRNSVDLCSAHNMILTSFLASKVILFAHYAASLKIAKRPLGQK